MNRSTKLERVDFLHLYLRMNRLQGYMVVLVLVCFCPTGAFPQSGLDLGGRRTRRDVPCRDNLEYPNGNICCLNCPAGTHMKSPCSTAGKKGQCEECEYGTYTEHSMDLKQCFRCTQCRLDQEIVQPCTFTHNTECRCNQEDFVPPDQACEVCKKCSSCGKDEVIVRNCTSTSNTECKKRPPPSGSASENAAWIVPLVVFAVVVIAAVLYWWIKIHGRTDSVSSPSDGVKAGPDYSTSTEEKNGQSRKPSPSSLLLPRVLVRSKFSAVEDECQELCESLTSTASNSQNSLTGPPASAFPAPPPPVTLVVSTPLNNRPDELLLKVVPVNGEESLRSCFEFFEDLDVNYHSRFFRLLGINDNLIKSKESLCYVDRVHDLLNVWLEKEGGDASLNDLLKALLDLNQRRTAEIIRMKAIEGCFYVRE
ncbi:tumor necrosis factor receptor superfamily member 10B-like [Sphaeramia orbicularis]|uniref:tumor necrosis factor receptor superfamily member 10B-like n=1 Tax=Sphaeramia orbicularis TaxID=375764 RepID=UPI00117EB06D|nr:tumor necrosis factor receptor superfamily member 10B-like [Sphaeramia orbicularis]